MSYCLQLCFALFFSVNSLLTCPVCLEKAAEVRVLCCIIGICSTCPMLWVGVYLSYAVGGCLPVLCCGWVSTCPMLWMGVYLSYAVGGCLPVPCCGWVSTCPMLWVGVYLSYVVGGCLPFSCFAPPVSEEWSPCGLYKVWPFIL